MENQSVSIFSKIVDAAKKLLSPAELEALENERFEKIVAKIHSQWFQPDRWHLMKNSEILAQPAAQDFLKLDSSEREAWGIWLAAQIREQVQTVVWTQAANSKSIIRRTLFDSILKPKTNFSAQFLARLGEEFLKMPGDQGELFLEQPLGKWLKVLGFFLKDQTEIPDQLLQVLNSMRDRLSKDDENPYLATHRNKLVKSIETLLFNAEGAFETPPFFWQNGDAVNGFGGTLGLAMPRAEQNAWFKLLHHAQKASSSKPSTVFLKEAEKILALVPAQVFEATVRQVSVLLFISGERNTI